MDLICLVPCGTLWIEYPFAKRASGNSRYILFVSFHVPWWHFRMGIAAQSLESSYSPLNSIVVALLQCTCAQSLSHVLFFATPWTIAHQATLSMGILQARILGWVAMHSSRGSSKPSDQTQVSHVAGDSLLFEPPRKSKNTGKGSLSLLQGSFLTQESNQGLWHFRWILYQLSYQIYIHTYTHII